MLDYASRVCIAECQSHLYGKGLQRVVVSNLVFMLCNCLFFVCSCFFFLFVCLFVCTFLPAMPTLVSLDNHLCGRMWPRDKEFVNVCFSFMMMVYSLCYLNFHYCLFDGPQGHALLFACDTETLYSSCDLATVRKTCMNSSRLNHFNIINNE